MTGPVRVVLVDDSALVRSMLRDILEQDGSFAVVGEAGDGHQAVERVREMRPDLVTMDLEMPGMGGLDAIAEIMASVPTPILVVSGVADAERAFIAVSQGAVEVVSKPGTEAEISDFRDKARLVATIPVITHMRQRPSLRPKPAGIEASLAPTGEKRAIAIACSTGGPQALARILSSLPAHFAAPILIAQHIAEGFAAGMAQWLKTVTPLSVQLGSDGLPMTPGVVYLAPSENNMTVTTGHCIALTPRPVRQIYRPSCDALLESVAISFGTKAVGLILTGMGSDGVRGMQAIHHAGGITLAQDEGSSVVFGMNAMAIAQGWIQRTVALDSLPAALSAIVEGHPGLKEMP